MKSNVWVTRTIGILLVLGASISLFLAQSSYWVNHTVFNQENFSEITSTALLEPSSRDAISSAVVDKALAQRPVAQRLIGDRAEKLISSLLGSDFSAQAVSHLVNATYKYITTPDRQDIAIELEGIKTPISKILALVQADDSNLAITIESIPDRIVLVESDSFPDVSGLVTTMLWLGPLFWLLTGILYAGYIYMYRNRYARAVYVVGTSIIIVAVFGILLRPIVPEPIASLVPLSNLRPVVQNVSDAFLAPFQAQMTYMLIFAVIALVVFSLRNVIFRGFQKLMAMASSKASETVVEKPAATSAKVTTKSAAKTTKKTTKKK